MGSTLTALAWNGSTGGILALDVAGSLNLNSATVSVSGLGFRGAAGRRLTGGTGGGNDFAVASTNNFHAVKGEGIAGTPRYVYNSATDTVVDNGAEGYPGGDHAKGAPGNAGGGGTDGNPAANDQNSGGGGGGNGGAGGLGGNTWNTNLARGGFGGATFAQAANTRFVMGGGGGGGTRNNDTATAAASGGAGGGAVFIRAGQLTGSGTINSNGADAYNNTVQDAAGGGGAGGSVLIWALAGSLTNLTINSKGGRGGDAWHSQPPGTNPGERHGPGGGGGGGFVRTSSAVNAASSATGGAAGQTTTALDNYGATAGANGTVTTGFTSTTIPGAKSGAECAATTAVTMDSFDALNYDKGVLLEWTTGFEVDNLGFNVYREEDGVRTQLNQGLLAGSALLVGPGVNLNSGRSYYWLDPGIKPSQFVQYWIEDVDLNGQTTLHGPVTPHGSEGSLPEFVQAQSLSEQNNHGVPSAQREVWAQAPASDASFQSRFSTMSLSSSVKTTGVQSGKNLGSQWAIAAKPGVKLSVNKDGWYRVMQPDLASAGLNVFADPKFLQLFVDGNEVPIRVNGSTHGRLEPQDSIEFYGTALDTASTDLHVYYLISGSQPGRRISTFSGQSGIASGSTSFLSTVELRERFTYYVALTNGDKENWFGAVVTSTPVIKTLKVTHLATDVSGGADQTALDVVLQGVSSNVGAPVAHLVGVSLNGMQLGNMSFSGRANYSVRFSVPSGLLHEGDNTVTVQSLNGGADVCAIDYIRLTYNHLYTADSNGLRYTASGGESIKIGGFSSNDVRLVDVTDPNDPREIAGAVTPDASGYSFTAAAHDAGSRLLYAFTGGGVPQPAKTAANQPSSWNQAGPGADIVVISNQLFTKSLQPLVDMRTKQRYAVKVVDVEDVYDEFSYGAKSPQAIKDFLSRTRAVWRKVPRYVLLVGDATTDGRNYLGLGNVDFVPTKMVASTFLEAASDDWFADFDDSGLAAMAVGRLPVRTAEDADTVVAKIVRVEQSGTRLDSLLVADRNDGFDFEGTEKAVKDLMPSAWPVQEVLRSQTDDASAKAQIIAGISQGKRIVNYNGHGSNTFWRGNLLTSADTASLTNLTSPSLVVSMTCMTSLFADPFTDSLGEALMKARNGGAFAVWGSSGLREPLSQAVANQELFRQLLGSGGTTIGDAIRKAKASVADMDLRRTWILFGDPVSRLQ